MTTWYTLDLTCSVCQAKGKTVILGTLLSPAPIPEDEVTKFLAKCNDGFSYVISVQKISTVKQNT